MPSLRMRCCGEAEDGFAPVAVVGVVTILDGEACPSLSLAQVATLGAGDYGREKIAAVLEYQSSAGKADS